MWCFFKKYPLLLFALTLIGLPVLIIVIWGWLNMSGMCVSEGRWLSEANKIDVAVEYVIKHQDSFFSTRMFNGKKYLRDGEFENIQDFKNKNHNCCNILEGDTYVETDSFLRTKTLGLYGNLIVLKYKIFYVSNTGDKKEHNFRSVYHITNCGLIREDMR